MQQPISSVDIAVYVALSEEFEYVIKELGGNFVPEEVPNVALTCFFGDVHSDVLGRKFTIAIIPAGKMGNTRSANVISTILEKLKPRDVVVLGIAGSLSTDLQPGDVFIPDSVNEYMANSAAIGDETSAYETSGNHFITDPRLLNRFQLFWTVKKQSYGQWRRKVSKRFEMLIDDNARNSLLNAGLSMRLECKLHVGDDKVLASGPTVGKGQKFVEWLKQELDRKMVAIEMETAGVYDATLIRTPAPRTIAIRGISDFADERKKVLETLGKGSFRILAVRNAVSLLLSAVRAGLFAEDTIVASDVVNSSRVSLIESRIKSAFVIGGVTGDTRHPDFEQSRLQIACLALGEVLAKAGMELIVCSPFPDSADLYTVLGYSKVGPNGKIQFHSPRDFKVEQKYHELIEILGQSCPKISVWGHPGPENEEAWSQAWLLCQLQALENADVVIALGGKVSKTANTLLHLAEGRRLPVVPFTFLGGAAQRMFSRYDWKRLHPGLDTSPLEQESGIAKTIEIANRIALDAISLPSRKLATPSVFFISSAKEDYPAARELVKYLKRANIEVNLGEDVIRANKMVQASIEQTLIISDVCIILWSKSYALSPWCYDELMLAVNRQNAGQLSVWMFNLDESLIVPKAARKIRAIRVKSTTDLLKVIRQLLLLHKFSVP